MFVQFNYMFFYIYQGRFEILSLSGSYMPTEIQGTKSRSGGMSVSLAGPDGRVVGGGLAGLLVAAGPVQVKKKKKIQITETQPEKYTMLKIACDGEFVLN